MTKMAAFGLGASLVATIFFVGRAVSKDMTKMIDYVCDPKNPIQGPRRG